MNKLQLKSKCFSSSTESELQKVHNLFSIGRFLYLPLSIASLCELILKAIKHLRIYTSWITERYTPLEKLCRKTLTQILQTWRKYERTNEHTNGRTDERKDENYIPVGINAGGIIIGKTKYGLTILSTVMILSFRTDRSGQTVQTQIRLLLVFTVCYSIGIFSLFEFWVDYGKVFWRPKFRNFTVYCI